jgi:hypothetical protein
VNGTSHFLLVLKLPALVVHWVFLSLVIFKAFTNSLLIKVAAQPESKRILMRLQSLSLLPLGDVAT